MDVVLSFSGGKRKKGAGEDGLQGATDVSVLRGHPLVNLVSRTLLLGRLARYPRDDVDMEMWHSLACILAILNRDVEGTDRRGAVRCCCVVTVLLKPGVGEVMAR